MPRTTNTRRKTTSKKRETNHGRTPTPVLKTPGVYTIRINELVGDVKGYLAIANFEVVETHEGAKAKGPHCLFLSGTKKDTGAVFQQWRSQFAFAEALGEEKPWDVFLKREDLDGEDHPYKGSMLCITMEENDKGYTDLTEVEAA